MAAALTFTGTAAGAVGFSATGAPWQVVGGVIAGGMLISVVQSVFPQESKHRLQWWRALLQHRAEKHVRDRRPVEGWLRHGSRRSSVLVVVEQPVVNHDAASRRHLAGGTVAAADVNA